MDNTTFAAADAAATINGGFSLIKDIKAGFESARVLDLSNANHVANVKNLTEFSEEHSKRVGPRQFYYPDTATGAVIQKYTTLALDGNAQQVTPTDNTNSIKGLQKERLFSPQRLKTTSIYHSTDLASLNLWKSAFHPMQRLLLR